METFEERESKRSKAIDELLQNIKKNLPELKQVLEEVKGIDYEDGFYRFYHGSFKAYYIQGYTDKIVKVLQSVSPSGEIENEDFKQILKEGTKDWKHEHNSRWHKEVRPILEAYFHARYFLEMAIKYGEKYAEAPHIMDYGWAAVLYLYGLR